ncbi:MAG: ribonuclease III [Finegoldia sp.]|nr:ribonuclease III [Finegoldia sp.]
MEDKRIKQLHELEEKLGYKFKDLDLLNLAFFHSSYGNETKEYKHISNERLEFLGDALLDLIVSDFLYKNDKNLQEGTMTKLRSKMVCEESFANMARFLKLGDYLLMGYGEERSGGKEKSSVLADTFEALFGAIYIDSGYESAFKIIDDKFKGLFIAEIKNNTSFTDYKSMMQEYNQKVSNKKLKYKIVYETGPDHDKSFKMELYSGNKKLGTGIGHSKKQAEQNAAKDAADKLGLLND